MAVIGDIEYRFNRVQKAFAADSFAVRETAFTASGKLGAAAEHMSAANRDTGIKKACYYVEGTPYERGYLTGLLCEPQISDMAVNFVDNIIFDFIGLDFLNSIPLLKKLLVDFIGRLSQSTWNTQPDHVHSEVQGILDGCKKKNPATLVTETRLSIMNVGFDVLCALVYTGRFLRDLIPHISPGLIKLPMMCNAFSVFGRAAGGGHFFGRDFMFVSGGALQNNLAHIINVPENEEDPREKLYPYLNITAPGIVGSISAMNSNGVAGGLNMSPSAACDTENVGVNSLILLRDCIMEGANASEAANVIKSANRGVSWNYVLSDGSTDTACTVEAAASRRDTDFLSFPSPFLLPFLPDKKYLSANNELPVENGAAVRWCGAPFPNEYLNFNSGLWRYYNAENRMNIKLYDDAFTPSGFINRAPGEENCPSGFYFAPQRTGRNVLITTNHFLSPHMRLCAMAPWTAIVESGHINDIQWRYDELNHQIQEALSQGGVGYSTAKRIIDFLAPYGRFPQYYKNNPKSSDGGDTRIEGCVSLFDLKKRTAESHYGYYGDEWIKTTLPDYI